MFGDIKEFLISFWNNARSKKLIKRFAGLIVIFLLTILIPLSIAICYVQFVKDGQKIISPDISVSLFDADGKLIKSETTQEDIIDASPLAGVFYKLTNSKSSVQKPFEFTKKPNMSYTVAYNNQSSAFKCYFEEDALESYIEDENGGFYSIDASLYSTFLESPFSETVYKSSVPPTLYTPLGDSVLPYEAEWTYALHNNAERQSKNYELAKESLTYRIAGAINFKFSRLPDSCTVTVADLNGEPIFHGSPEKLASLTVKENSELLISVDAEWKKSNSNVSYGKQQYEFKIICVEPSNFSISSNEAVGGQILLLTVSDVDDINSIIYSPTSNNEAKNDNDAKAKALSELYSYEPIFVKGGNNAYAILPIPANIPNTEFTFSLSCGISRTEMTLNIKSSSPESIVLSNASISNAQKAEFSRILFHLKHSKSDMLLLNGNFIFPDAYGFTQTQKYNGYVNESFIMLANSYTSSSQSGISVRSANVGIVYEVGFSPLLGSYVIIDHGMGILTWYCGLSDVSVNANDIVKKGDPIGRAGSSSLLCENGVNVFCSVGGILIDPSELK